MANALRRANLAANTEADGIATLLNTGYLRIYDGTQAATADTAVGAQVLLAELRFNATASPAASAGVATYNAITSDASANATGTASWFRALKSDGTSAVFDGSVGTSASDINFSTVAFVTGAVIAVSSFTYTATKA